MYRLWFFIAILLVILSIRFYFFFSGGVSYKNGQQLKLETTLLSEPSQTGSVQRLTARLSHGERVFITLVSYPQYHYGDNLGISGKLQIKEMNHVQIYSMSFPKVSVLPSKNPIIRLIIPLREHIMWLFHTSMSQPEASLLLGIVFGIQESMPKDFSKALQQAGVLHVIAASGMNVTMIAAFLSAVFGSVLKRQYSLMASIVVICFYAVLSGLSASIVRASLMGCLVFVAQIIGRQSLAFYGLLLAGFVMLIWQPFLLFDVGFQLSFVATCGLIVFSPVTQYLLKRKAWHIDLLAETDFLTTIIAQIATLPILLGAFGSYSPVSILVNVLVLWTIPLLMILGGVGALVGLVVPLAGRLFFYLSLPFLYYFEKVVWFFGSLPVSLHLDGLSWEIVVGYYCLLIAGLLWIIKNQKLRSKDTK